MFKNEQRVDRFLVYGILVIVVILLLGKILPPSGTTVLHDNEVMYKNKIKAQDLEIKQLKDKDKLIEIRYQRAKDSVKILSEKSAEVRVVYRDARRATETRLDSTNLHREVLSARLLIDAQEAHINGLLGLVSKSDSLLDVRLSRIKVQDIQLVDWEGRYNNIITLKDAEINAEIKRGRKKFWRGFFLGAAARQALEFIP